MVPSHTTVECPSEKKKPGCRRSLAFLHKFSGDVVDGRDVVRIHGVAEPERVSQKGGPQLQRIIPESNESPSPRCDVGRGKDGEEDGYSSGCAFRDYR